MNDLMAHALDHVGIYGITGSGKTTLAKSIYQSTPGYGIFLNIQDIPMPGSKIYEWDIINLEKSRTINFSTSPNTQDARAQADQVAESLIEIGGGIIEEYSSTWWATVYIDEASVFLPQGEENMMSQLIRRGKRYGIKIYLIAQNPVDISKTVRTQTRYHVIFYLNPYNKPYFEQHQMPYERIVEMTARQYHYCIYDGKTLGGPYKLRI